MNSNIPVIQGPIPTQGSVIEFAGRKYFTNAADGSTSGAGSSSGSDYSSSDTEKRRVALAVVNGNRKKQKTSPSRTLKIDNKEIADAFAFLDCHPEAEEEEEESAASGVDPFPVQPPPSRRKRKAVTQQPVDPQGTEEEMVEEVRIEHRDLDWNDENSIEEDDKERAGHFKPVISPFRRTIEAMLRPGEDPHDPRCWGCDNQEDGDYAVVEKEWKTLMNMFEKRLHRMHPAHLGVFMYRYFAERTAVKMTQTGKMNANGKLVHKKTEQGRAVYQFDFSVWSAFSMFRHFTEHHLNPHTHITMDLWKLLFAKIQLEADGFYRRHDLTGRIVVDKDAVQTFKLLNQQIYQLYRMKPEQMLFTNPNSAIDTQGYSYLNQERQIIHSHGGTDLFRMNYDTTN